jgi:hypothetical protein
VWCVVTALLGCRSGPGGGDPDGDGLADTTHTGPGVTAPGGDGCDGRDDDGDGLVDEDGWRRWYPDADGDGIGDPALGQDSCRPGDGWVLVGGDCDDADSALADVLDPDLRWVDRSVDRGFAALGPTWDGDRVCLRDSLGGGIAVADLDGDGHEDVFVARTGLPHQLLRGDGGGGFTTEELALPPRRSAGATPVDVDGDGDLDLVVGGIGPESTQLLVNDGAGGFTDEALLRGVVTLDDRGNCGDFFGSSAADVDGDGDLDLLVAGWDEGMALGRRSRTRLFENDGTGRFTDVTVAWGLDAIWDRAAFGGVFFDWDRDGDPDVLLVADWNGTVPLENTGRRFELPADEAVFTDDNGMGADLGDPDGDGDLDVFLTSIWAEPLAGCSSNPASLCSGNRMYGRDRGRWVDATDATGVRQGQWDWGTTFVDWDLDGALDLVFTGGFDSVQYRNVPGRAYHNGGDGRFDDATCRMGLTWRGLGRGVLAFDADEDGDEDLVLSGRTEGVAFYELDGPPGHALHVELRQPGPNPFAVGAQLRVRPVAGAPPRVAAIDANPRFTSGRGPWAHFGLGAHAGPVAEVEVTWPDGGRSVFTDVPQGRVVLER